MVKIVNEMSFFRLTEAEVPQGPEFPSLLYSISRDRTLIELYADGTVIFYQAWQLTPIKSRLQKLRSEQYVFILQYALHKKEKVDTSE